LRNGDKIVNTGTGDVDITKYHAEALTGVKSLTLNHQCIRQEISSHFGDEQVVIVLGPARRCGFRDRRGDSRWNR
jgi:hypothetical protein